MASEDRGHKRSGCVRWFRMQPTCPICETPLSTPLNRLLHPFCSERCKMVDLGKWLGEDYVIREAVPGMEPQPED